VKEPPILFFDGTCGLCDRAVTYIFDRDRAHALVYAPLQGETAKARLPAAKIQNLDSMVLLVDGEMLERSTAVFAALALTGGPWKVVSALALAVPRGVRDAAYDLVAKYRYRLFGRTEACRLPSPAERAFFLD
jgi:predicted DCC family thiol-disulfide oxidoreductase YuxK